jgi:hypothetical protein
VTVNVAVLLVAPVPLSFADMAVVVLLKVPVVLGAGATSTEMKQAPLALGEGPRSARIFGRGCRLIGLNGTAAPISPPVRVMIDVPGVAVTVPSQLLLKLLGLAITRPGGKLSVNAIPVRVTSEFGGDELLFGLLIVKLNKVVWF